MGVVVRDAEPRDAAEIAAVHVRSCKAAYRGLMSEEFLSGISEPRWAEGWRKTLGEQPRPLAVVAVVQGRIIGLCSVATPSRDPDTDGSFAEFVAVYVDPDTWRAGAGTAMMSHAVERLRQIGWQAASLWVAVGNDRAVNFYQRLGFKLDGSVKMHEATGSREIRMQMPLLEDR